MEYDCDRGSGPGSENFSSVDKRKCERLLLRLFSNDFSTDFQHPASPSETRRYKELIKTPMDLTMVKKKLQSKEDECYGSPEEFVSDVRLIFFNCAKYYKATSEIGSAGLYLEDYFEEQLKLVYPDKVFPGGREEQMIPPLEDEIEEEEEQPMEQSAAAAEDKKPQSPAGDTDGGMVPKEEPMAPAESENLEESSEMTQKETEEATADIEGGVPPAEEAKPDESIDGKQAESCPASDMEPKDGGEDEKAQLPAGEAEDTPDTSENPASEQQG